MGPHKVIKGEWKHSGVCSGQAASDFRPATEALTTCGDLPNIHVLPPNLLACSLREAQNASNFRKSTSSVVVDGFAKFVHHFAHVICGGTILPTLEWREPLKIRCFLRDIVTENRFEHFVPFQCSPCVNALLLKIHILDSIQLSKNELVLRGNADDCEYKTY